MRDVYHHGEVLEAICLLCQGAAKLLLDTDGTDVIYVGSNRLFEMGDAVELVDDTGVAEAHTISHTAGLNQVVLDSPVVGAFGTPQKARLRLTGDAVPALSWVGHGRPVMAPTGGLARFPCVVVEPRRLVQPLRGGTNRTVTQAYWSSVYYVRRRTEGEEQERELFAQTQLLFNLLMTDPYLGGTCWHGQVSSIDYSPGVERELQERGAAVRVVKMDVVAQRSESVARG